MKLTLAEIKRLQDDFRAAPKQPLRDSMVMCGVSSDGFTTEDLQWIARAVGRVPGIRPMPIPDGQ